MTFASGRDLAIHIRITRQKSHTILTILIIEGIARSGTLVYLALSSVQVCTNITRGSTPSFRYLLILYMILIMIGRYESTVILSMC
jgi:hypothetical protein